LTASGTLQGCQSTEPGYEGVYDLNGNVAEWEDICGGAGRLVQCRVRGGSFYTGATTACDVSLFGYRSHINEAIGFRCCASG
jgi:formylglycine-generating enzyme required for sulfatase activity